MLDLKWIREQPDKVKQALKDRNASFDLDGLLEKEGKLRRIGQELDQVRHQKRIFSDEIGKLKRQSRPAEPLLKQVGEISVREEQLSFEHAELEETVSHDLLYLPNLPHESVPAGKPPEANKVLRSWGQPRRFDFKPRTHVELAELLGLIDFGRAAKIAGSHFVLFTGLGARLERALIQFMLDLQTQENHYIELSPPLLVNRAAMTGTGQLPKFEEDMYRLPEDDLFLIPTAEVAVTSIHASEVLEQKDLPLYYTAATPCFRREAGAYGKETKGRTRVHQFDKVELVKLATPESSYEELEKLLADAESVLQKLELSYRVVSLCAGDLGFSSAKTYDLEAHSAGTGGWLEVSSCSNFEEFQARRANIRYREAATKKVRFVHTLNGSGVALARTVIALLETHQNADGSVTLPQAIRPYLNGMERLAPR